MITLQHQLQLLWQHVLTEEGRPRTIGEVARGIGISEQALLNLLHGRTLDPRLQTLLGLIDCFGISLDYFDLSTEADCLNYLAQCGRLGPAPDLLQTILQQAPTLSPETLRTLLRLARWRLGSGSS